MPTSPTPLDDAPGKRLMRCGAFGVFVATVLPWSAVLSSPAGPDEGYVFVFGLVGFSAGTLPTCFQAPGLATGACRSLANVAWMPALWLGALVLIVAGALMSVAAGRQGGLRWAPILALALALPLLLIASREVVPGGVRRLALGLPVTLSALGLYLSGQAVRMLAEHRSNGKPQE